MKTKTNKNGLDENEATVNTVIHPNLENVKKIKNYPVQKMYDVDHASMKSTISISLMNLFKILPKGTLSKYLLILACISLNDIKKLTSFASSTFPMKMLLALM